MNFRVRGFRWRRPSSWLSKIRGLASMSAFYYDGVSLHYQLYGRGEAVLLIHGLGCSGADWALQVSALESQFYMIVPDLPGCGSSTPLGGTYSIAGFASALWALLVILKCYLPISSVSQWVVQLHLGWHCSVRPACLGWRSPTAWQPIKVIGASGLKPSRLACIPSAALGRRSKCAVDSTDSFRIACGPD